MILFQISSSSANSSQTTEMFRKLQVLIFPKNNGGHRTFSGKGKEKRKGKGNQAAMYKKVMRFVKPYKCNLCELRFPFSTGLKGHYKNSHNGFLADVIKENGALITCEKCHQQFDSTEKLSVHHCARPDATRWTFFLRMLKIYKEMKKKDE